jgi:protein involved in polysaccharide export with SLBB domain
LADQIKALYSKRLRNVDVTVMLENVQEPMVYVLGEVGAPKSVPLRQARTAIQALALAGGVTKTAAVDDIAVIRADAKGRFVALTAHTDDNSQPGRYLALSNLPLQANDVVLVPESYRGQTVRLIQDFNTLITPYYQLRILQQIVHP